MRPMMRTTPRPLRTKLKLDGAGAYPTGGPGYEIRRNGQLVENLRLYVKDRQGIWGENFTGLKIRWCVINYTGTGTSTASGNGGNGNGGAAPGIDLYGCTSPKINNVKVFCKKDMATRQTADDPGDSTVSPDNDLIGIRLNSCNNAQVSHIYGEACSSVLFLNGGSSPVAKWITGKNMMGPFPRGQLVQFNDTPTSGSLTNFQALNSISRCWTEDIVNVGGGAGSQNITIKGGFLYGNNSPSGSIIQWENTLSTGGVCSNVVTDKWGNGIAATEGPSDTHFTSIWGQNGYATMGRSRGTPSSGATGGLAFYVDTGPNAHFTDCRHVNSANPGNDFFDPSLATVGFRDVTTTAFTVPGYYRAIVPK